MESGMVAGIALMYSTTYIVSLHCVSFIEYVRFLNIILQV